MKEKTIPVTTGQKDVAATHGGAPAHADRSTRDEERYIIPPVDIYETADGLTVVADLPGVAREAVEVRVEKDILTIEARVASAPTAGARRFYNEYTVLNYFRQFELSDQVDQGKISAELRQGVLTLNLPKPEAVKPRTITVQAA